jgi:hypothetical protein
MKKVIVLLGIFISTIIGHATPTVQTNKMIYSTNESITVNVTDMFGDPKDWIAIYPSGASNEWGNVIRWSWTVGVKTGSFSFDALPQGEYEARAFFENSYNLEASSSFTVSDVAVDTDAFIAT